MTELLNKYVFYFTSLIKYVLIATGLFVFYRCFQIEGPSLQLNKLMLSFPLLMAFLVWLCHIAIEKLKFSNKI